MKSIWKMKRKNYPSLHGEIKTEILVIGGGLAGILTAYELSKSHKVILVEKNKLASGTTSKTTGKISALQGIIYQDLIKDYGVDFAKQYFNSQQRMIDEYHKIITEHNIDCNFTITDGYLFTNDDTDLLLKEYYAYQKMNIEVELLNNDANLPIKFTNAIKLANQATFNPLKFISGLPKNFDIYEHSEVKKIQGNYVYGDDFTIEADQIVVATLFPIKDIPGNFYAKLHPSIAYTIGVPCETNIKGAYIEVSESGMSYRNYQDFLLVCGLDHRSGRPDDDDKLKKLLNEALKITPCNHEYYWSNIDMMTFDKIPYIGLYSPFTKNLFVITGFNKWGMANSLLASCIITDLIDKKANSEAHLFSPFRIRLLKQLPAVISNAYVNTRSILSSFLIEPHQKELTKESSALLYVNGVKKSVYVDKLGIKHYAPARCEHLKSHLSFNPNTLTWDCPCHGSRYSIDGEILHGPANQDWPY